MNRAQEKDFQRRRWERGSRRATRCKLWYADAWAAFALHIWHAMSRNLHYFARADRTVKSAGVRAIRAGRAGPIGQLSRPKGEDKGDHCWVKRQKILDLLCRQSRLDFCAESALSPWMASSINGHFPVLLIDREDDGVVNPPIS